MRAALASLLAGWGSAKHENNPMHSRSAIARRDVHPFSSSHVKFRILRILLVASGKTVALCHAALFGDRSRAARDGFRKQLNYQAHHATEPTPFPLVNVLTKRLVSRGYLVRQIVSDPAWLARAKAFILDGLADGTLKPIIARTFGFDDIVEAHRFLESNTQFGKIVVTIGGRRVD